MPSSWSLARSWRGWLFALPFALFVAALGLRIGRVAPVPAPLVAILALLALVGALGWTAAALTRLLRGPRPRAFDPEDSVRCEGEEAERIRGAASWRRAGEGAGYVRRAGLLAQVGFGVGAIGVLASGLLNVALHVEGSWIQFADSGRDLDLRDTYQTLDVGLLANPAELRYGVLVGEIRPEDPQRLLDLSVVNPRGERIREATLAAGGTVSVGGAVLHQWGLGPGLHVTILHEKKGRLFDGPIPLLPTGRQGAYEEAIEGDGVLLDILATGWPSAADGVPAVDVTLRSGEKRLFQGRIEPRRIYRAAEGYAIIAWELRPWVRLEVIHRTYRTLTLSSLALWLLAAAAWALARPRPFWFREDADGSLRVSPPSAWAALRAGRKP